MEGLAKCQFTKQQKYSSICRNHFIHKKTQIEKEQYCGFDNISLSVEYMTVHFCVFISAQEKYCLQGYFHSVKLSPVYTCKIFRPVLNSLRQVIFKQIKFETFKFAQSFVRPLTTRANREKTKRGVISRYIVYIKYNRRTITT